MDRWIDRWMDRWMDGWIDRWIDGLHAFPAQKFLNYCVKKLKCFCREKNRQLMH
jgi:hypothetical protein